MKTIARHLIAELYDCEHAIITEVEPVRERLLECARLVGATVMNEAFHRYSPQGVTGTLVIAESHISVHTWPEHGYAAIDIFTCGGLDPRPGFAYLKQAFGAREARMQEIVRGLPEELADDATVLPEDVRIITDVAPLA